MYIITMTMIFSGATYFNCTFFLLSDQFNRKESALLDDDDEGRRQVSPRIVLERYRSPTPVTVRSGTAL